MTTVSPEKSVLDKVVERLSDVTDGLNATFNQVALDWSLPVSQANMTIDFVSAKSPNFVMGDVDPLDFEETSPFRFPIVSVFVRTAQNQNLRRCSTFSGTLALGVNVYLSWKQGNVARDFESYGNAVASAMYQVFNRARSTNPEDQDWGNVVWNGDIGVVKGKILKGAENWFQVVSFTLVFEADQ